MTTARDLREAIRADPEDNRVRLVYADYLEEHGEAEADRARAELIRVQVALADPPEDRGQRRRLWEREEALLARQERAGGLPLKTLGVKEGKSDDGRLAGGLVGVVPTPARKLLDNADALFAAEPVHAAHVTEARRL